MSSAFFFIRAWFLLEKMSGNSNVNINGDWLCYKQEVYAKVKTNDETCLTSVTIFTAHCIVWHLPIMFKMTHQGTLSGNPMPKAYLEGTSRTECVRVYKLLLALGVGLKQAL